MLTLFCHDIKDDHVIRHGDVVVTFYSWTTKNC